MTLLLRAAGVLTAKETSPHQAYPDGSRGHRLTLDRTGFLDAAHAVQVDSEVSLDGGKTWIYAGGFTIRGGGDTKSPSSAAFRWPENLQSSGRLIRTHIIPLAGVPSLGPLTVSPD